MKSEPLLMQHESHVFDEEDIEAIAEFIVDAPRERLYALGTHLRNLRRVAREVCPECERRFADVIGLIELECARRLDS